MGLSNKPPVKHTKETVDPRSNPDYNEKEKHFENLFNIINDLISNKGTSFQDCILSIMEDTYKTRLNSVLDSTIDKATDILGNSISF